MKINNEIISKLYQEAYIEFNNFGNMEENWSHIYNEWSLIQLKQIVKYLPNKEAVFLDIGTGQGIAPRVMKKLGVRAISLDWPVTGGYDAIESVKAVGVEGYYCEVGNEPMPVENESVHCVLIADVLEHICHSPKRVMQDIYRVLKPGGVCIATVPNATRLTIRIKVALGYSNWPYIGEYYDSPFHGGHHHEYTSSELKEIFRRENFIERDFILYEKNARYTHVASLSKLQSRIRSGESRDNSDNFLIGLAKYPILLVTNIIPSLRSEMLIVASKQ
jgi:SAM-dependent methyltransferase